jgi:hypothetical protein
MYIKLNNKAKTLLDSLLIGVGLIIMLFTVQPEIGGDGLDRFNTLESIYKHHHVYPTKFSLVQPLLSFPLYFLADLLDLSPIDFVAYYNIIIFIGAIPFLYIPLAEHFGPEIARTVLLLVVSASMFPHHLQHYYGEVTSSLLWAVGILVMRKRRLVGSVLIAGGILNTPALVPILILTFSYMAFHERKRLFLCPVILCILGFLGENYLKFGDLFSTPYLSAGEHGYRTIMPFSGNAGFSYPLLFGLLSIFFSFGKGIVFFVPSVFLVFGVHGKTIFRTIPAEVRAAGVFALLAVLLYSKWWAWYGGWFWGPRFFLFLSIPGAIITAVFLNSPSLVRQDMVIGIFLLMISTWVGINGYLFGQHNLEICIENHYALESLCWYTPEFSALWRPFVIGPQSWLFSEKRIFFAGWQVIVLSYMLMTHIILRSKIQHKA